MKPKHIITAVALTAACGISQAATLIWAARNDTLTLDPHSQNHATTVAILSHCYEALVRYDKDFRIEPALATSWEAISPTQWRFNLRKNVKFHDGSPFTADDVQFSFDRIRQPQGTMQAYVGGVTAVRKIDDHTVDFTLEAPNPVFLRRLVVFMIMSKTWAEKTKSENVQNYKAKEASHASLHTNGTGPYVIKSWQPSERVVMSANPAWWDQRSGNVTEVIYRPIGSDATRLAALASGEVDLVTDVPVQDVRRLRQDPKIKILDGMEARAIFIALDSGSPELKYSSVKGKNPFKDVRVRRALSLAVDRDAIRRVTMRELSVPGMLLIAPQVHGYEKEIDAVPSADVDQAKKLLAAAGYPDGFEFTLDCPNNRYVNDEKICQTVVAMWARIGVNANLQAQGFGPFMAKIQSFDTSAYLLGWGTATFDALFTLQALARTKTKGADGSFNFSRVSDPELDRLIDAMKTEMDAKKRDALIREALVLLRDRHYFVPLHYQVRPWAMKKNVSTVYRATDTHEARYTRVD